MTPRERFLAAWRGEMPDKIPFAIWHTRLFPPDYQPLLEREACIVVKSPLYRTEMRGIRVDEAKWTDEQGVRRVRTTYHTAAGELSTVRRLAEGTTWTEERLFKSPADYDALLALVASRSFCPTFEQFASDDSRFGESGIARPMPLKTPLYEIIYELLGMETFSLEMMDHPERIEELYRVLLAKRREEMGIVAASPARIAIVEGNVSFDVVGPERFQRYYFPAIEEACELCRAKGILTGAHLDGNNRQLAPYIARTSLDCIEAHTPPPDCDLPLAEARLAWPGKAIHINFPSSLHLQGQQAVIKRARELLAEAAPGKGFVMGITEDIPTNDYLVPLAELVRTCGKTPLPGNLG